MTEQRVCCDKCLSVILEGRTLLEVKAGPLLKRRESIDLCQDCTLLLEGFLSESNPGEHRVPELAGGAHVR